MPITTQTNPLWDAQSPYLTQTFGAAQDLYNKGAPGQYGGNTVAGFDPVRAQGLNLGVDAATGAQQNIANANTNLLTGILGGTDAYTNQLAQQAAQATGSAFGKSGTLGSSRNYQAANNAAAQAIGDRQLDASRLAANAQGVATNPGQSLQDIGATTQGYQQSLADANKTNYDAQANQPYNWLKQYQNLLTPNASAPTSTSDSATLWEKILGIGTTAAGLGVTISDERAKTNIQDYNQGGQTPNLYSYNNQAYGGRPEVGVMAQEVAQTDPDMVRQDPLSGILGVDYQGLSNRYPSVPSSPTEMTGYADGGFVPQTSNFDWEMVDGRYQLVPQEQNTTAMGGNETYVPPQLDDILTGTTDTNNSGGGGGNNTPVVVTPDPQAELIEDLSQSSLLDTDERIANNTEYVNDVIAEGGINPATGDNNIAAGPNILDASQVGANVDENGSDDYHKNFQDNFAFQSAHADNNPYGQSTGVPLYEQGFNFNDKGIGDLLPPKGDGNTWGFTGIKDLFDGGGAGASGDTYSDGIWGDGGSPGEFFSADNPNSAIANGRTAAEQAAYNDEQLAKTTGVGAATADRGSRSVRDQRQAELRADAGYTESAEDVAKWRGLSYPEKEQAIEDHKAKIVGQNNTGVGSSVANILNAGSNPATTQYTANDNDIIASTGLTRAETQAANNANLAQHNAMFNSGNAEQNAYNQQVASNEVKAADAGLTNLSSNDAKAKLNELGLGNYAKEDAKDVLESKIKDGSIFEAMSQNNSGYAQGGLVNEWSNIRQQFGI